MTVAPSRSWAGAASTAVSISACDSPLSNSFWLTTANCAQAYVGSAAKTPTMSNVRRLIGGLQCIGRGKQEQGQYTCDLRASRALHGSPARAETVEGGVC